MAELNLTYPAILGLFGGHMVKGRTESRAFLAWFLDNYYRLDETETYDCICDDRLDKGVDGVYVNDQLTQIDVFQTTIARGPKTQGDVTLKEFIGTLSQFKDAASVRHLENVTQNNDLRRILQDEEVAKKIDEGYEVRGVFITNAKRDYNATELLDITPSVILYDEEELQRAYIYPARTGPIDREISFSLGVDPYLPYGIGSEMQMVIAPLSASDLIRMEGIENGELFAWNVRQWLGQKTKVNKDIESSLKRRGEHKYFPAFHNGLTILCRQLDVDSKAGTITISGYAVVNGCQSLTSLYHNRAEITSDLKFLTKFIMIPPDDELALKITDHANNQNGTTGRDLKSNNPIQIRLQAEIHHRYSGDVFYRIKRSEHPEWDQKRVIENDLAARILLAFDLRQPWACHQTYKLFDELYGKIFGRPEVNADRIVALRDIFELAQAKVKTLENNLFGNYGLTRFLLMYLIREALEADTAGKAFAADPSSFVTQPNGRERLRYVASKMTDTLGTILDTEITRRNEHEPDTSKLFADMSSDFKPFDYKRELKNPNPVRVLRGNVISHYQFLTKMYKQGFSQWWDESEEAVRDASSQPGR